MTYHQRKVSPLCTYPGCTAEPLSDNCQCERHRDWHRARNRRWKRAAQWAREQLGWEFSYGQ